jgi:hypothetical protein
MALTTLIVAPSADVERIGATMHLDELHYPHFHCGNLDAGLLGQVFWESTDDQHHFAKAGGAIELAHRHSNADGSVLVHALPQALSERYARMNDAEIDELSARWRNDGSHIRLQRSNEFNRLVMGEVARLARIAHREDRILLVRTSFRNSHDKQL